MEIVGGNGRKQTATAEVGPQVGGLKRPCGDPLQVSQSLVLVPVDSTLEVREARKGSPPGRPIRNELTSTALEPHALVHRNR